MRRATVLAVALVAALLPAAPASAVDSTVVVHGLDFPQDGTYGVSFVSCSDFHGSRNSEQPLIYIDLGPGTPPAGLRSMRFDLDGGNGIGSFHAVDSVAGTTVVGMSLYTETSASGVAYVGYQPPADAGTSLLWVGRASLAAPAAAAWQGVDVADLTWTWARYDTSTADSAPVATAPPATVAPFVAGHGGDGAGFFTIGFGCDGNPFNMDAWRVGSPGNVTTYDLEGTITATGISGSTHTVTAGKGVTLHGSLTDTTGGSYSQAPLILEARPYGASDFSAVATANTTLDGDDATVLVRPKTQTVYRWRYEDTSSADGSVSPTFTVRVRTAVTAKPASSVVKVGKHLVVTGRTTPAKPGFAATLWRVTSNGPRKLTTAAIKSDGTYRLATTATRSGRWTVFVTVPAGSGNLAGTSPRRAISVVT